MDRKFVDVAEVLSKELDVGWMVSSHSAGDGNCVRLARLKDGDVAVGHAGDPDGPALIFSRAEMIAFFAAVEGREFREVVCRDLGVSR